MRLVSIVTVLITFVFLASCGRTATTEPGVVKIENRIFDHTDLLTFDQENKIFQLIQSLETKVGSQVGILIIDTLNGEPMKDFSLRTAKELQLGRANYDDGLLLTIAVKNREIRIEVGYGLAKIIDDETAEAIIREDIAPRFGEGDFFNGIKAGVEKISTLIEDHTELIGQKR